MSVVLQSILTIILVVEFITGTLGNGFIVLVNWKDWVKGRKISSVDQILMALAISRIGMLWSFVVGILVFFLSPGVWMPEKMFETMSVFWTVTSHLSIWLATCLSIFYFLKIANFSNSIFLYLKWRVKKVISVVLFVGLFLLILNILVTKVHIDVFMDSYKMNMSSSVDFAQFSKLLMLISTTSTSIPFMVSLVTFLLLIFSLWKHRMRMRHNARGTRDIGTAAHIKALQTVIAFLVMYTIFFLSFLVQVWKNEFLQKRLTFLLCQIATAAFPSFHSFVLILGNNKLRQTSRWALKWLRCKAKDAEFSHSQAILNRQTIS